VLASRQEVVVDTIGQRLTEWRTRAGLSQAEVGRRVGVDRSTVSGWESGRRDPSRHLIARVAEACGAGAAERWEAVALPVVPESGR
jgi:transcriptional regulator with XRE-family HTH domain